MPGMFLGVGALAVWVYVRYPRLRPATLRRAMLHVAISIATFQPVPLATRAVLHLLPTALGVALVICTLVVPMFCYVLLSWLWVLARIGDQMNSTPRGGHRVRASAR